jgi:hypothetical protein
MTVWTVVTGNGDLIGVFATGSGAKRAAQERVRGSEPLEWRDVYLRDGATTCLRADDINENEWSIDAWTLAE